MNILNDKWLEVKMINGEYEKCSLLDCFKHGAKIRKLVNLRPTQFAAVIRLLVLCAQGALDGPKTRKEWKNCLRSIPSLVLLYLTKYSKYFDEYNFIQSKELSTAEKSIENLSLYRREGNNACALEHSTNGSGSDVLLSLLAYQSFSCGSPLGSKSDTWGRCNAERQAKKTPCSNQLVTILVGKNLLETIWLNMISKEDCSGAVWGKPIWEYDVNSNKDKCVDEISKSYLGRLLPIARAVKRLPNGSIMLTTGIQYKDANDGAFDSMMSTVIKKKDIVFVNVRSEKHPWRYLHVLAQKNSMGVKTFANIRDIKSNSAIEFVALGMEYEPPIGTKPIDEVIWRFKVESKCFDNEFAKYEGGVKYADNTKNYLWAALKTYMIGTGGNADSLDSISSPISLFWSILDRNHTLLLSEVCSDETGLTKWIEIVDSAANIAYDSFASKEGCKQLRAYVLGLKMLNRRNHE